MTQLASDYQCYYCGSHRQVVWAPSFTKYMCCTCKYLVSAHFLNFNSTDEDRILKYLRLHGVVIKLTPLVETEGEQGA